MKLPTAIQAYRGFGGDRLVHVAGQVSFGRHAKVHRPYERDRRRRLWQRLRDAVRLAISPRISHARVRIHCGGVTREMDADGHGHFTACLELPPHTTGKVPLWREYLVELIEPRPDEPVTDRAEILLATPQSRRVVVSDIDDTVIFTGVSNKLKMLWRLFAHEAEDRVPFPGITALYRGLHQGPGGEERNPMIYVSRSPWAIYPTLEEFFQEQEIPIGPVLQLRDWGITLRHPYPRRAKGHKREMLDKVLQAYEGLPLVLIGDSGQRDPELYATLARECPERVAAVYIRDLGLSRRRSRELDVLRREMSEIGVPFVAAADSEHLAMDAAERGWISGRDLQAVHARFSRDAP